MTRLNPSRLKDDAKTAQEEKRKRVEEERLDRKRNNKTAVAPASAAQKDRVWEILVIAALNNIPRAFFDRLNAKERNFLVQLGLFSEPENDKHTVSWRDTHLARYKSELEDLDRQINEIERTDPFSEALSSLSAYRSQIAKAVFSLQPNESPFKVGKSTKHEQISYEIEIKEPTIGGTYFEEYNIRWLFWLLGDGQLFLSKLEKKLMDSARLGESYEILIAKPSKQASLQTAREFSSGQRYERAWVSSIGSREETDNTARNPPGTPYDYFSDNETVAKRGPKPDILRYFLELLNYKCTLRTKKDESVLKIKWP